MIYILIVVELCFIINTRHFAYIIWYIISKTYTKTITITLLVKLVYSSEKISLNQPFNL